MAEQRAVLQRRRNGHDGGEDARKRGTAKTHAGGARRAASKDGKINVAIIGVGNCASSLVQGRYFYQDAQEGQLIPGLMHVEPRRLPHPRHQLRRGDRHRREQGRQGPVRGRLHRAEQHLQVQRRAAPGRARLARHDARRPRQVPLAGHHEGARARPTTSSGCSRRRRRTSSSATCPSARRRRRSGTWSRCWRPAAASSTASRSSSRATHYGYWPKRFQEAGLPIIGDDIKSQVGATIVHRVLTRLFRERGVRLDRTYQLNFGGNTDFLNMLERERLESKKISKTNAVTSQLDYELPAGDVHVGPSDHVPWLLDRKWCYIRMEGTTFGNVPLNVEVKLEVWDSPNSAGVVIDAIRCCKIALDRGHRRAAARAFGVLHEVAADAVPGRCRARHGGGVHSGMRPDCSTGRSTGSSGCRSS